MEIFSASLLLGSILLFGWSFGSSRRTIRKNRERNKIGERHIERQKAWAATERRYRADQRRLQEKGAELGCKVCRALSARPDPSHSARESQGPDQNALRDVGEKDGMSEATT